ncbi:MAG: DUF2125 domain-containing protein, partial [Paracoccaceae bacterium]|nr:DUF2125 domain-containing protein [Paracoccaceae bacterium]
TLTWGDVTLFASGRLIPDSAGFAQGTLDLRLDNWQKALAVGVAVGVIPASAGATWEQAASLLAARSNDANRIDIALTFGQGLIRLGALPLGAAPRLN